MSENREEILADFQACTGIDDVGQAILYLEESNWNLLSAINVAMPQDHHHFTGTNDTDVQMIDDVNLLTANPVETATDMLTVGNNVGTHVSDHNTQPSTSQTRSKKRLLHFTVHYNEKNIQINISDTGTLAELKNNIQTELGIPPCQQLLTGWVRIPRSDQSTLSSLQLPKDNILYLSTINLPDGVTADEEQNVADRLTSTFTLRITNETNKKKYNLNYAGTRNILSIKTDVYNLTEIPVRHQVWNGWPTVVDDNMFLAQSGVTFPEHELTVRNGNGQTKEKGGIVVDLVDSDNSSVEEFEDASESFNVEDDMFIDNLGSKKMGPLIPENVDDDAIGCIQFSEQFTTRYGPIHPTFFTGALDDALKEACTKPAKDRKILAMYLHHDNSVLSNVFCTQLLCFESVVQMLENNFIVWGWDLTYDTNKIRLQSSITRSLGSVAAMTIRNIPVDKLPAVILIMKIRSSTDIYTVIYGNVSVNEFLLRLVDAVDVFTEHQRVEVREEEERADRELVKWEQDQAYHESLEADRAKEEAKMKQAAMENQERKRLETERAEEEAKKERHRLLVEACLPAEPSEETTDVTKIRFRLPKGKSLERRFTLNTPLKVLLDYLVVKGYPANEFKVILTWPRKDLTAEDQCKTMQDLNLCAQETVILEER